MHCNMRTCTGPGRQYFSPELKTCVKLSSRHHVGAHSILFSPQSVWTFDGPSSYIFHATPVFRGFSDRLRSSSSAQQWVHDAESTQYIALVNKTINKWISWAGLRTVEGRRSNDIWSVWRLLFSCKKKGQALVNVHCFTSVDRGKASFGELRGFKKY